MSLTEDLVAALKNDGAAGFDDAKLEEMTFVDIEDTKAGALYNADPDQVLKGIINLIKGMETTDRDDEELDQGIERLTFNIIKKHIKDGTLIDLLSRLKAIDKEFAMEMCELICESEFPDKMLENGMLELLKQLAVFSFDNQVEFGFCIREFKDGLVQKNASHMTMFEWLLEQNNGQNIIKEMFGQWPLYLAVECGLSEQFVQKILDTNIASAEGVDALDKVTNESTLGLAVRTGKTEYVDVLLQAGANPNEVDPDIDMTPFAHAIRNGYVDVARKFREFSLGQDRVGNITHKVNPSLSFNGVTVAHLAAMSPDSSCTNQKNYEEVITFLKDECGVDFDQARDERGRPPIFYTGSLDAVRALGGDITVLDGEGFNIFHAAGMEVSRTDLNSTIIPPKLVEDLLKDPQFATASKKLLRQKQKDNPNVQNRNYLPLHRMVYRGDKGTIIAAMEDYPLACYEKSLTGRTPIFYARNNKSLMTLIDALKSKGTTESMLGSAFMLRDKEDQTPMLYAIKKGYTSTLLTYFGANGSDYQDKQFSLNPVDEQQSKYFLEVMLQMARYGTVEMFKYLLEHGLSDKSVLNRSMKLNVDGITKEAPIVYWVAHFGRDDVLPYLLDHGADLNAKDQPMPVLNETIRRGKERAAVVMLNYDYKQDSARKLDPWVCNADDHDRHALHHAASAGIEITKALLADKWRGKDHINDQDKTEIDGRKVPDNTPLHLAVENSNIPVIRALIAAGADKTIKNLEGLTPVDLAHRYRDAELLKALGEDGQLRDAQDIVIKDSERQRMQQRVEQLEAMRRGDKAQFRDFVKSLEDKQLDAKTLEDLRSHVRAFVDAHSDRNQRRGAIASKLQTIKLNSNDPTSIAMVVELQQQLDDIDSEEGLDKGNDAKFREALAQNDMLQALNDTLRQEISSMFVGLFAINSNKVQATETEKEKAADWFGKIANAVLGALPFGGSIVEFLVKGGVEIYKSHQRHQEAKKNQALVEATQDPVQAVEVARGIADEVCRLFELQFQEQWKHACSISDNAKFMAAESAKNFAGFLVPMILKYVRSGEAEGSTPQELAKNAVDSIFTYEPKFFEGLKGKIQEGIVGLIKQASSGFSRSLKRELNRNYRGADLYRKLEKVKADIERTEFDYEDSGVKEVIDDLVETYELESHEVVGPIIKHLRQAMDIKVMLRNLQMKAMVKESGLYLPKQGEHRAKLYCPDGVDPNSCYKVVVMDTKDRAKGLVARVASKLGTGFTVVKSDALQHKFGVPTFPGRQRANEQLAKLQQARQLAEERSKAKEILLNAQVKTLSEQVEKLSGAVVEREVSLATLQGQAEGNAEVIDRLQKQNDHLKSELCWSYLRYLQQHTIEVVAQNYHRPVSPSPDGSTKLHFAQEHQTSVEHWCEKLKNLHPMIAEVSSELKKLKGQKPVVIIHITPSEDHAERFFEGMKKLSLESVSRQASQSSTPVDHHEMAINNTRTAVYAVQAACVLAAGVKK